MEIEYHIKEDGEFQFLETGEGPILLVLHGLFGALSNFEHVIEHFKSNSLQHLLLTVSRRQPRTN